MNNVLETPPVTRTTGPKWFNSPVVKYAGKLPDMVPLVPEFERRSFDLA